MVALLQNLKYYLKKKIGLELEDTTVEKLILLYYSVFQSKGTGVSKNNRRKREIIISLTSIPERINKIWITVESLLRQTYKPDKIILWLAKDEFSEVILPDKLRKQTERGLTIRYCDNIKSYKKFFYTAIENPNAYIVTVDDDVIYSENMLVSMVRTYIQNPHCVICNRSHYIRKENKQILPYKRWIMYETRKNIAKEPSYNNFFTGCGGTLLPMFLMNKKILDEKVFTEIAPYADDVWLNFLAWISGIKIKNTEGTLGHILSIQSSSVKGLSCENLVKQKNDMQIQAVLGYLKIDINDYI